MREPDPSFLCSARSISPLGRLWFLEEQNGLGAAGFLALVTKPGQGAWCCWDRCTRSPHSHWEMQALPS